MVCLLYSLCEQTEHALLKNRTPSTNQRNQQKPKNPVNTSQKAPCDQGDSGVFKALTPGHHLAAIWRAPTESLSILCATPFHPCRSRRHAESSPRSPPNLGHRSPSWPVPAGPWENRAALRSQLCRCCPILRALFGHVCKLCNDKCKRAPDRHRETKNISILKQKQIETEPTKSCARKRNAPNRQQKYYIIFTRSYNENTRSMSSLVSFAAPCARVHGIACTICN